MPIAGFRGRLFRSGDPGYDEIRHIFNREFDPYPALIARPCDGADVATAVRFARERGLALAIRGGGHNFAGYAGRSGGIVLDLRDLRGVRVDPDTRTAQIGAGEVWRQVDSATHPFGLAAAGGSFSSVGVVGFTLGTGLGWLARAYGLAADNLVSATVVTASGTELEASEVSEPELFWALRGGTGNFGVVTRLTTRVHPVHIVMAGMMVFAFDRAADVLRTIRDEMATAPPALSWAGVLACAPPAPPWPAGLRGRPALLVPVCWSGALDEGERLIESLRRATGPAELDLVGPVPFPAFQSSSDESAPQGLHWDVRSEWLSTLDDTAIDDLVHGFARSEAPMSEVLVRPLGGAITHGPETPFAFRHARWLLEVLAGWLPSDPNPETHRRWMTQTWSSLLRVSAGGPCISHLGVGEPVERVQAAYGPLRLQRLREAKTHYDPDDVFQATPALALRKADGCSS